MLDGYAKSRRPVFRKCAPRSTQNWAYSRNATRSTDRIYVLHFSEVFHRRMRLTRLAAARTMPRASIRKIKINTHGARVK